MARAGNRSAATADQPRFTPFVPAKDQLPEIGWLTLLVGAILGILFGASSLYLVLKVGLTVSASIPVAVLSITLFRLFSSLFGLRRATILENNIVQTTGSAGESIAFGVGVTIPALMLLGFEMELVRVMTVGLLGGLLGILMMIPLRRAFIVRQHGRLPYPEGTACADVLIAGERGGATARTVFVGFGLAFFHKFCTKAFKLWPEGVEHGLTSASGRGLPGASLGAELSPELLGVGYIIGPRIAAIMVSGGVLAYLVLTPLIKLIGQHLESPLAPATSLLIRDMDAGAIRANYVLYIAAGAVATGGVISMLQALPMILSSIGAGLADLRRSAVKDDQPTQRRTERDLPMWLVLVGTALLVAALAAIPNLGLGLSLSGLVGAGLIVLFGFLFVTVSSRLTGEIGSSSNPISGMTVATLLLTCLIFLALGWTDKPATLMALTIAAVVCIAASNGGTTAQDLKTGFLVGATPSHQQWAILVGAMTSALVIGVTLMLLNEAGTVYSKKPENLPNYRVPDVQQLTLKQRVGGQYAAQDTTEYHVWHVGEGEIEGVLPGKYLVNDQGQPVYLVDPAINGRLRLRDDGTEVANKFEAPKTRLMALIIGGILEQRLPWELVLIGGLIAVALELAGVPSLPFAVGVYLPISTSLPIFVGGSSRWLVDRLRRRSAEDSDSSPGVLLSSGYIAGGAIAGVLVAFFEFLPEKIVKNIELTQFIHQLHDRIDAGVPWHVDWPALTALLAFSPLVVVLLLVAAEWLLKEREA